MVGFALPLSRSAEHDSDSWVTPRLMTDHRLMSPLVLFWSSLFWHLIWYWLPQSVIR